MINLRVMIAGASVCLLQGVGLVSSASAAVTTFAVSGYVWIDANGDGSKSVGEKNFPGATVELLDRGNAVIRTVASNGAGNYVIPDVAKGAYRLRLSPPNGFTAGPPTVIWVNAKVTEPLPLTKLIPQATEFPVSGYVWVDSNGDGSKSVWEKAFPGAAVELLDRTNTVIRTVNTNNAGNYTFADVPKGAYRIRVSEPNGYTAKPPTVIWVNANFTQPLPLTAPRSLAEESLNPFGDSWGLAKSNPSLPLAVGPGCYRRPVDGLGTGFTELELQYLRSLDAGFYIEACAVVLETEPAFVDADDFGTSPNLLARIAQFKAANPDLKYIGYGRVTEWNAGPVGWEEIYTDHKDWFLYKIGSNDQAESNIVVGINGGWILDITNTDYQDFLAQRLAAALPTYGIDGLVFDNVAPAPRVADISTVPTDKLAAWQSGWISFLTKLKAAVGPNRYVFASVPRNDEENAKKIVPIVDGIMVEDTFSAIKGDIGDKIASEQPVLNVAANAAKWIFTTENTKVDGSTFATTTAEIEHVSARYYLAAYYVFKTGKMLFYYNTPTATVPQYGAEAFFTDWNVKVGAPTSPYARVSGHLGVFKRNYENSIVYLNNSKLPYVITIPGASEFKFDPDGHAINNYVLPPKSGFILSRAEAFQYQ